MPMITDILINIELLLCFKIRNNRTAPVPPGYSYLTMHYFYIRILLESPDTACQNLAIR